MSTQGKPQGAYYGVGLVISRIKVSEEGGSPLTYAYSPLKGYLGESRRPSVAVGYGEDTYGGTATRNHMQCGHLASLVACTSKPIRIESIYYVSSFLRDGRMERVPENLRITLPVYLMEDVT